jgi:hypothetical protein
MACWNVNILYEKVVRKSGNCFCHYLRGRWPLQMDLLANPNRTNGDPVNVYPGNVSS